jgi:ubiquitin carboxyl-terminal hydrolase 5/13
VRSLLCFSLNSQLCFSLNSQFSSTQPPHSYADDEDDMVKDPWLADHLLRFGIDIMSLEKTDKTLAEMEVEMNRNFEFATVLEGGQELVPRSGPGLIGLKNMGATCYLASIMQVLFTIPEFIQRYGPSAAATAFALPDPARNLTAQLVKLGCALLTDRYAGQARCDRVCPRSFKAVVGKRWDHVTKTLAPHPEFSGAGQQDVRVPLRIQPPAPHAHTGHRVLRSLARAS